MEIIETPVFTRKIKDILSDDEYRELQWALVINPEFGALIPESKGLRKMRWAVPGRGKRGGLRIIYYWYTIAVQISVIASPEGAKQSQKRDCFGRGVYPERSRRAPSQ